MRNGNDLIRLYDLIEYFWFGVDDKPIMDTAEWDAKVIKILENLPEDRVPAIEIADKKQKELKDIVFTTADDLWEYEGSPSYCRSVLSVYAELTKTELDDVEDEWDRTARERRCD